MGRARAIRTALYGRSLVFAACRFPETSAYFSFSLLSFFKELEGFKLMYIGRGASQTVQKKKAKNRSTLAALINCICGIARIIDVALNYPDRRSIASETILLKRLGLFGTTGITRDILRQSVSISARAYLRLKWRLDTRFITT